MVSTYAYKTGAWRCINQSRRTFSSNKIAIHSHSAPSLNTQYSKYRQLTDHQPSFGSLCNSQTLRLRKCLSENVFRLRGL